MTGRFVGPKPLFRFSNGVGVRLNRLGPLISIPLSKKYPPPRPPVQRVEVGPDKWREEANPTHPDHVEALARYQEFFAMKMQDAMLNLGIDHSSIEIDLEQVAMIRAEVLETPKEGEEPESDFMVYVKYCCVASNEDLVRYAHALKNYDSPSAEGVAAAAATFPSQVARESIVGDAVESQRSDVQLDTGVGAG